MQKLNGHTLNGHQITNPAMRVTDPIFDCGKCARCKRELRRKKIRGIVFGTLWTLWAIGGLSGAGAAIWSATHPEPKTAEEIAKEARLAKIDTKIDALQNERDEIDPPQDDGEPMQDESDRP